MKIFISVILTSLITVFTLQGLNYYREKAIRLECETTIADINGQLSNIKKEYGTFKSGFSLVKFRNLESCQIVNEEGKFKDLRPQFEENSFKYYFIVTGSSPNLGTVENSNVIYLNKE